MLLSKLDLSSLWHEASNCYIQPSYTLPMVETMALLLSGSGEYQNIGTLPRRQTWRTTVIND